MTDHPINEEAMQPLLDQVAYFFTGAREYGTREELLKAKSEIGALMAEIIVAKVGTGLITKQAEAIRAGVEGDKSLATSLDFLAADCESKLRRISEGWDSAPTDTRFSHHRGNVLQGLTRVHEAAQGIADLTEALIRAFSLPEEPDRD